MSDGVGGSEDCHEFERNAVEFVDAETSHPGALALGVTPRVQYELDEVGGATRRTDEERVVGS